MPVHRSAFTPPPKVMSAVVHIIPKEAASGVKMSVLENLTGAAFGQRRKMLRQSLKGVPGALEALHKTGIAEDRRPETVNIAEWCALAKEIG
jgi:16S rRNA (adenine1518-N6/adenine1519-N6)-dimethyltransferase